MITLYTLLGLTFIIFIHEFGHFCVARWVGVKVYTFSIGIGPKLITLYKDKLGTKYIISWIPLGGYVRMKGQEDVPTNKPESKITEDHYLSKTPFKRLLITLAGVTMNTISAYFFIIIAYSIGVNFSSNKVGGFAPSKTSLINPLKVGDEIISVESTITETFEDVITQIALYNKNESKDKIKIKIIRDNKVMDLLVPLINPLENSKIPFPHIGITPEKIAEINNINQQTSLYLVHHLRNGDIINKLIDENNVVRDSFEEIYSYIFNNPTKTVNIEVFKKSSNYEEKQLLENVVIGIKEINDQGFKLVPQIKVIAGYPAEKFGLLDGDIILSINDSTVNSWEEIIKKMNVDKKGFTKISVLRDNEKLNFDVKPIYDVSLDRYFLGISMNSENNLGSKVSAVSKEMDDLVPGIRLNDIILSHEKEGSLMNTELIRDGHKIVFSYDSSKLSKKESGYLFDLVPHGKIISYPLPFVFSKSIEITIKEFNEVITFFTRLISGDVPLNVVGGPIAIFEATQIVATSKGWSYFILLFAKISISLVFINLLPIPILDGGHAALILYEMVRGKPMSEKIVRGMQFVGMLLLITIMVYVNYNDISRLINR